jgi:hypothetical protein
MVLHPMGFLEDDSTIQWRLSLKSSPAVVYQFLTTDEGRARFWAESTEERDGQVFFQFPNGQTWAGKIIEKIPAKKFSIHYYGGSLTTFKLSDDGWGGTDLLLRDEGVMPEDRMDVIAGWVSVLMALKGAADFGIDLRNHDPKRTWDHGYVGN